MKQSMCCALSVSVAFALFCLAAGAFPEPPPHHFCTDFDKIAVSVSPDTGQLRPDALVRVGTNVHLSAIAEHVHACNVGSDRGDVTEKVTPLKNPQWTIQFRPPAGLPKSGPPLQGPDPLHRNFAANERGTYVVEFRAGQEQTTQIVEAATIDEWISIGPDGRGDPHWGGRVNSIAFDAAQNGRVFAASARGGVWRSDDIAQTWYPLSDHKAIVGFAGGEWPKSLAVSRLAVAPGGRIYAITGESERQGYDLNQPKGYAFGLLASDDGGLTWSWPSCSAAGDDPGVAMSQVIVDPLTENVYVSSDSGVFRSIDSGQCWTRISPSGTGFDDLAIQNRKGITRLLAVLQQPVGSTASIGEAVIQTNNPTDAMPMWKNSFAALDATSAMDPNKSGIGRIRLGVTDLVAYAAVPIGDVVTVYWDVPLWSDAVWIKRGDASHGCYGGQCDHYDLALAVNPANPFDVVVGGVSVNRSTDSGLTFTDLYPSHPDTHAVAFDPWTQNRLWIGNDGGVEQLQLTSTAASGQWHQLSRGMSTIQFFGMSMSPSSEQGIAGGTQDNGSWNRTVGRTWSHILGGDGKATAQDAGDPNVLFAQSTNDYSIYRYPGGQIIGSANGLANDPRHPGIILGTAIDADTATFQLYQGAGAPSLSHLQWTCADPTPQTVDDAVMAVLVMPNGDYMIGTNQGLIWKVDPSTLTHDRVTCAQKDVGLGLLAWLGAPTYSSPSGSEVARGQITGLALDPRDPSGQSFYATLGRYDEWRVVHFGFQAPAKPWWVAAPLAASFPHAAAPSCLDCSSTSGTFVGPIGVDPVDTRRVYVGTDNGLYVGLADNSGNWSWQPDPTLPQVWVESIGVTQKLPVSANTAIRASTFGRSMWERVFPSREISPALLQQLAVVVRDRIHPWERYEDTILQADYRISKPVGEAIVEIQPTVRGKPVPFLPSARVPITGVEGSALARLSMKGNRVPIAADSDAVELSLITRAGKTVLRRQIPLALHWRRADARSIHLDAVAEMDAAADPVDVTFDIVGRAPSPSGSTPVFFDGARIQVVAPPTIRTPRGPAAFREWRLEGSDSDRKRDQQSYRETKLSILLDGDITARAVYESAKR